MGSSIVMNILSVRAIGSLGAESSDIVLAEHLPGMFVSTVRSMLTESTCVPWTVLDLALWIDVKVLRMKELPC
jgi:hypothetical protein